MKIPKRFRLHGLEITVKIVPPSLWTDPEDWLGVWDSTKHEIKIQKTTRQTMEHTFFHELIHAVLEHMGREKLSRDEPFVDMLSGLLMQALSSAE